MTPEQEQLRNNALEMQGFYKAACTIFERSGDKDEMLGAIPLFDAALDYLIAGKVIWEEEFYLNLNYMKFWTYARLLSTNRHTLAPDEAAAIRQDLIKQGQHTLALIPAQPFPPFENTVLCNVSNSLSWMMIQGTPTTETLEAALAIITRALPHILTYQHNFLYDTQVRLLLKLDRHDEAYAVVHRVLSEDPGFPDFDDLKTDAGYTAWLLNNPTK